MVMHTSVGSPGNLGPDILATVQSMSTGVSPRVIVGSNHLKLYGNRVTSLPEHREITTHQATVILRQGCSYWNIRAVFPDKQDQILVC